MITVLSTGNAAPTKEKCIASVAMQRGVDFDHVYVEAAIQSPRRSAAENVYQAVHALPPDRIVAWLDGDDWFPDADVLSGVELVHRNSLVWLTYGSYVHADGRPGISSPYQDDNFRGTPWRASHLKTFRAGLFQRIDPRHLKGPDGAWAHLAIDHAVMFPMLEMAGQQHARFVVNVRYVYNYASSYEHNASPSGRAAEREAARYFRSLPRYERLLSL